MFFKFYSIGPVLQADPSQRVSLGPMPGPFDWYSAIEIGIAAVVVGIIVLIAW